MQSFTSGAIAIGDAAGLIHPCLGAGIGYALESGVIAANHVLQSLQSGDTSSRALRGYGIELVRKYQTSFRTARFLRRWMNYPGIALNLVKLLKYT
jgi:flavin-dependent dehydrogenase